MKKLLILMAVLFVANMTKADDAVLQVWFSDGEVMSINLNDNPKTTYKDGNLLIQTDNNSVTYPLEKVKRYTYATSTSIDTPAKISAATAKKRQSEKTLHFVQNFFQIGHVVHQDRPL